jgi:hypothetical protein
MKKVIKILFIGLLGAIIKISATPAADPTDNILVAYLLTPAERAQFNTSDNKASAFWTTDWTNRDYIDMNTSATYSYPGRDQWTGAGDCEMWVRAAADQSGLYLNFTIEDNVFLDPLDPTAWGRDAVDIFFDSKSSNILSTCCTDQCVLGPPCCPPCEFIETSRFQIWMGALMSPRSMLYSTYDPISSTWTQIIWHKIYMSIDSLSSLFPGLTIEVYNFDSIHKGLEMYLPWRYIGTNGLANGDSLANRRFAFTTGYNDEDSIATVNPKRMYWKTMTPNESTAYWGDIQIASDVGPVAVHKPLLSHPSINTKIVRTEFFNLKGERITKGILRVRNSVVIERDFLANGKYDNGRMHFMR